jgi:hypothetical protein
VTLSFEAPRSGVAGFAQMFTASFPPDQEIFINLQWLKTITGQAM